MQTVIPVAWCVRTAQCAPLCKKLLDTIFAPTTTTASAENPPATDRGLNVMLQLLQNLAYYRHYI